MNVSNPRGFRTLRPAADDPSATILALSQYCRPPPAEPRWRNRTKGIANSQVGGIRCCVDMASYGGSLAVVGLGEQAATQYDGMTELAHVVAADVLILWGIVLVMLTSRHML